MEDIKGGVSPLEFVIFIFVTPRHHKIVCIFHFIYEQYEPVSCLPAFYAVKYVLLETYCYIYTWVNLLLSMFSNWLGVIAPFFFSMKYLKGGVF